MKKRGVASIIAAIFLVMLMGIAMTAFFSIYNEYKSLYLVRSEMNQWEAQRLEERLVEVKESGGGEMTYTFSRTFLVSDEYVTAGEQKTDTPRLWLFDIQDGDFERIESKRPQEINVTFTILTSELQSYTGGSWNFKLRMYLSTQSANMNVTIYAYNHQTGQFDEIDSFITQTASYFEWSKSLEWETYVNNENATIRIHEVNPGGHRKIHLRIDQMVLEGNYTSTQSLACTRYNVTSTDPPSTPTELGYLKVRDGNCLEILGDIEKIFIVSGIPTNATYQDISAYITVGSNENAKYNVDIYAYDFTNDLWVLKNSTYLDLNEERRIRVPLSMDYISNTGEVKLKIVTHRITGTYLYLDEVAVDATSVQGGVEGQLVIRNESPFTSRIVRIWYIGTDFTYAYDPSSPIVLQPGETIDLADYHPLSGITLVKVITDLGNVFSFVP